MSSSLTQAAMGFGVVRSTAGLVLTLEACNNIKTAILEIRQKIDALHGAQTWTTDIQLKNIEQAISDLMYVESQIAPEINAELNKDA